MGQLLIIGLATAACGDDETGTGGGGGSATSSTSSAATTGGSPAVTSNASTGVGGSGGGEAVSFEPCPLYTGTEEGAAECATISLPASREEPALGTVNVFVKHVVADGPRRGQLWLLQGGPGGSGVGWEGIAEVFAAIGYDSFIPDHRGVGRSDRLSCPEQEAFESDGHEEVTLGETAACLDHLDEVWGDRLAAFNGTEAAADIGDLIDLTRGPDDRVFVFGVSYGTQWAHRYLQQFPDQAQGIIIDSICVPDCDFTLIDRWYDDAFGLFLDRCADDASCNEHMGGDPRATVAAALARFEDGSCADAEAAGFTRELARSLSVQVSYDMENRRYFLPMWRRFARCSAADVDALAWLAAAAGGAPEPLDPVDALDSNILADNIIVVEDMPDDPPSLSELETIDDTLAASAQLSLYFRALIDVWPPRQSDAYQDVFGETDVPILMLQGALDFIPIDHVTPVAEHFAGPGQSLVVLPTSPHGTLGQSPTTDGDDCSFDIFQQFVEDPMATLNTDCTSRPAPIDFEIGSDDAEALFGTPDAWDGEPEPQNFAQRTLRPELQAIIVRATRKRPGL